MLILLNTEIFLAYCMMVKATCSLLSAFEMLQRYFLVVC